MHTDSDVESSTRVRTVAEEPTALLVNTASRTGEVHFEETRRWLGELGVRLVEAQALKDPSTIRERVEDVLTAGARRVLIGGGDGTLSAAAEVLVGRDVRMGVLPLGTCNDFARSIYVPLSIQEACRVAVSGEVHHIDVGLADQRVFLNAATVGLSAVITRSLSDDLKKRLGRAAFAVVGVSEAWSHEPFRVRLETEDDVHEFDAHQVVVGNGRYHGGGTLLSPTASHEDGILDIYVILSVQTSPGEESDSGGRLQDLWNLFRIGTLLGRGRHIEHPAVRHLRTSRVRLVTQPSQAIDVDGEFLGETPAEFKVRRRALQVIAPALPR